MLTTAATAVLVRPRPDIVLPHRARPAARPAGQTTRARDAGLVVGFSHFLWPGDLTAQAEHFVAEAPDRAGDILAVDRETTGDFRGQGRPPGPLGCSEAVSGAVLKFPAQDLRRPLRHRPGRRRRPHRTPGTA